MLLLEGALDAKEDEDEDGLRLARRRAQTKRMMARARRAAMPPTTPPMMVVVSGPDESLSSLSSSFWLSPSLGELVAVSSGSSVPVLDGPSNPVSVGSGPVTVLVTSPSSSSSSFFPGFSS